MNDRLAKIKIAALFHDPPHKPLVLKDGHEQIADQFVEPLVQGIGGLSDQDRRWIRQADHLASGADRFAWLVGLTADPRWTVNPREELEIVHPLEGRPILVPGARTGKAWQLAVDSEQVEQLDALFEELGAQVRFLAKKPELLFLLLWRFTPDLLRALEGSADHSRGRFKLGTLWELLPADTRIPDHPVMVHNSLVAALAAILAEEQKPALLRVALGPVQDFIAASRKLSDLWASSTILAEAAWQAMEPVVRDLGPDHLVFPSLRLEPRFDRWFLSRLGFPPPKHEVKTEKVEQEVQQRLQNLDGDPTGLQALVRVLTVAYSTLPRNLLVPSIPNVFTAIVPDRRARELAKECERQARDWWRERVRQAAAKAGEGEEFVLRAEQQGQSLLEVFWSVIPWDATVDPHHWVEDSKSRWHKNQSHAARVLTMLGLLKPEVVSLKPNAGVLYADLNEQAELLVSAAKQERYALRSPRDEGGLKCSVCGEREVLGGSDFWTQRTTGYAGRKDRNRLTDNEQLCGVCTAKRHFDLEELEDSRLGRQPSTGEIAASAFKLAVIRACTGRKDLGLMEKVQRFVDAARRAESEGCIDKADLHAYCCPVVQLAVDEEGREDPDLQQFAHIDGQWLLPFPREEAAKQLPEELLAAAKALRQAAAKWAIPPPRPYLAVVDFDGDEMGKWLSGTHPNRPRFIDSLHSKLREALLETCPQIRDRAKARRPITPAFHAALSSAAAAFARIGAPLTIEGEDLPGHLVYAGGDDALFLAPIPEVLELVRRLRLRFSGHPQGFSGAEEAVVDGPPSPWLAARLGKYGKVWPAETSSSVDRLGLAFGSGATASAGLCVFHYRWPLGSALEAARQSLEQAKRAGRDRLGITIQRRSGSVTQCVLPFTGKEGPPFPLQSLQAVVGDFAAGRVSPRLASLFRAELAPLLGPRPGALSSPSASMEPEQLWNLAEVLARRVAQRREVRDSTGSENGSNRAVMDHILQLGKAVRNGRLKDLGDAELRIVQWSELLTAAAFLAREG